jgi:hypothetical protein
VQLCNFSNKCHFWPFEPIDPGLRKKILFICNICNLSWINIEECTTFVLADFLKVLTQYAYDFPKMWIIVTKKIMLKLFMYCIIYKDFLIVVNNFKRGNLLLQLYYFLLTFMSVDFQQLGAWLFAIISYHWNFGMCMDWKFEKWKNVST